MQSAIDTIIRNATAQNDELLDVSRDARALVLKVLERRSGAVPAVALTAYARTEDRLGLRAGFQLHLAKPVHASELITVASSLAARRA